MKYHADEHFIYLSGTPYSRKNDLKEILSGQWISNSKFKGYRFAKTLHAYRELYKAFPELREMSTFINDGKKIADEYETIKSYKTASMSTGSPLRKYQNQDVHFLYKRGSALVLNEMRTGKTPTMICTMKVLGTKKNLVVCPSSLVFNWKKEFEIWYPDIYAFTVSGTPTQRENIYDAYKKYRKEKVLIISKDTLKRDLEKLKTKFDCAVVDEAHFLRNYKSAQSKAIFNIDAKIKYALTGTPAVKHGVDVYGLFHFINPNAFPSYWQFADRYFVIQEDMWGKSIGKVKSYREEELKELMEIHSVQRKRKDILKWLPKAQHQTIPLQMEGKQLKLYDQMVETFMASEEDIEIDTMNVLTQVMRLRQLCLDPRLLGFDVVGEKTKALLEFAEDNHDPFVVMTTFSSYFKLIKPELEKLGKKVAVIDGSVKKEQRQKIAEDFQKGRIDILLANIIAAGVGITLDRADTIVFLDKAFNPADNEQAQDRIVPTTEEKLHPINIISLVCAGSMDDRINQILDEKMDLTEIINQNGIKGLL